MEKALLLQYSGLLGKSQSTGKLVGFQAEPVLYSVSTTGSGKQES